MRWISGDTIGTSHPRRRRWHKYMASKKEKSAGAPPGAAGVGRPRLPRAEWRPETYKSLAQLAGVTPRQVADALGVSVHSIYCWQSTQVGRVPTVQQAEEIAKLLTLNLGRRITPKVLARDLGDISVVFSR